MALCMVSAMIRADSRLAMLSPSVVMVLNSWLVQASGYADDSVGFAAQRDHPSVNPSCRPD